MKRVDKMLYEAKLLDALSREYKPCYLIETLQKDAWTVRGTNYRFESEARAVAFCQERAAGRPVGIVICDIPRILPESDYIDDCAISETQAMKELMDNGIKGPIQLC